MPQLPSETSQGAGDHFELVFSSKVEDFTPVSKFRSKRTGIKVYVCQVDGPTVNGYLCLATEAHDDDGLPHTLEHLIFLGSEDYPFKGVLDLAANRCMASGTNAWTATDHTCYTVMTAGSEGFLNFLPAYADHILYPLLTDSGFITEVHHVNGEGEDAGVVYCEMQGIENTGENLVYRAMLQSMYPGHCGYKSETGGALKNLRESTSNEKVRNYHEAFYRPENLCIIITGQVASEDVFLALKPVEDKILAKGLLGDFTQPWQTPVPPLMDSLEKTVMYPCDDANNGMVQISWRSPKSNEMFDFVAVDVLLRYLTETAVSPLRREFVELDSPYCSKITYQVTEYSEGHIDLMFENVPFEKLHKVKVRLFQVLQKLMDGEGKEIDLPRMLSVINRKILTILSYLESEPHDFIVQRMIRDFLHGTGNENLDEYINHVRLLKEMMKLDSKFWVDLLKKYLLDRPVITIVGEPNCELMEKMTEEENLRISKQREQLSSDGLKLKAEELGGATKHNEIPPPPEMISAFKIPSTESIRFHPIKRSTNHSDLAPDQNVLFSLRDIPFRFQLDDIHTNFVMLHALLDTSSVSSHLKLYLPLFLEVLVESPINRNGVLIPHDVVVKELAEDTVCTANTLGIHCGEMRFSCASYAQIAHLFLQVSIAKYEHGVRWLHELLCETQFTQERVKIIATKMVNDVARCKREGNFIAHSLASELCFAKASNRHVSNLMRQHRFLTALLLKLDSAPQQVLDSLMELRAAVILPNNVTVHTATDVNQLVQTFKDPNSVWKNRLVPSESTTCKQRMPLHVQHCHELLSPFADGAILGAIVGVGSVESAFLRQSAPSISSHTHPDLPALFVLLQYLTQLEGPMWRQVRGLGLAYGCSIRVDPSDGLLNLSLYRSTHVVNAYKQSIVILKNHLDGTDEWDLALLESARSSLIFELIQNEETVKSISVLSLVMHLNSLDSEYKRQLLKQVSEITIEDLKRVGPIYIPALFDAEKSWLAICCHPSKVDEIVAGFKEMDRDLIVTALENSFMDKIDVDIP